MEKEMATHSSTLAWNIPWTEELQSLGSWRVVHDWSDLVATAAATNRFKTTHYAIITPNETHDNACVLHNTHVLFRFPGILKNVFFF